MQDDTTQSAVQDVPTPVVDTQPEVTQSPAELEGGHDVIPSESEVGEIQSTPVEDNTPSPDEVAEKRATGKLKQTQSELDAIKRQHEATVSWIFARPERAKEAIMEMRNLDEAGALKEIENLKRQNPQLWQEAKAEQGVQQAPQVDPYQAAMDVRDFEKFEELVPDMNVKLNPDRRDEIAEIANDIGEVSRVIQRRNPGMSRVDSWVTAYKQLTGKTDQDIAQAKEQGYLQGLARGNGDKASTLSAPTAGSAPTKSSFNLTDEQRKVMQQSGIFKSEEEYVKYLNM